MTILNLSFNNLFEQQISAMLAYFKNRKELCIGGYDLSEVDSALIGRAVTKLDLLEDTELYFNLPLPFFP